MDIFGQKRFLTKTTATKITTTTFIGFDTIEINLVFAKNSKMPFDYHPQPSSTNPIPLDGGWGTKP